MTEAERILEEYRRREREIPDDFYALTRPANLFLRHGQERALRRALEPWLPLGDRRVLEIGCGTGQWLGVFTGFGARPEKIAAIELDAARAAEARARHPNLDVRVGDAAHLPWPDRSFDLVFQSTVFTSILDDDMRRAVAAEMRRVVAAGGAILWYDFAVDNPRNRRVRGISRRALAALFPGCRIDARRTTLAPPLARAIAPRARLVAELLDAASIFNTHLFAVIRP